MHRQRTKLSARMNRVFTHRADRVAKAVERQGIRATYELHDRLLSNRDEPRALRRGDRPRSTTSSRASSRDVREQGYSSGPSRSSSRTPAHWGEIEEQRDRFVASTEADLAEGGEHVRVRPGKEFVVRLQSYGVELGPEDPWFRAVASQRLLDIANTYLEMWSKLEYVDVWYSVPQPATARADLVAALAPRLQRQAPAEGLPLPRRRGREHGAVPVRRRQPPGGPYADAWGWEPLGQNYPTEEELESRIPRDRRCRRSPGPAGTLLFCNTAGFHRGGFSTTKPRVLATATYSSPASLASLTVRSYDVHGLARRARRRPRGSRSAEPPEAIA